MDPKDEQLFGGHINLLVKLARRQNPKHDRWFRFGEYVCHICGEQMCQPEVIAVGTSHDDELNVSIAMDHYTKEKSIVVKQHGAKHIKEFIAFL